MSILGIGGSKATPFPVVTSPAAVPMAPTPADPSVALAGANTRAGAAAYGGTVANTGGQPGLVKKASTAQKSLLGD
jgi:hypothetical protein